MVEDPVLLHDWHVAAHSEDVRDGNLVRATVLGEDLVLWRCGSRVLAWQDLCIHRGARLSLGRVEAGRLICPYHGWEYDESGRCLRIPAHPHHPPPARARVKAYAAQERYGLVWICLGEPRGDVPPFPEWNQPGYRFIFCGPYPCRSSGPRFVENFLDVSHFPFVHEGLLGDPAHAEIADYQVEADGEGIVARDIQVWQPDPDGTGRGANVAYTYRVFRPLTAHFAKTSGGSHFAIFFTVTPVSEMESIGWMWIAMDYAHDVPDEQLRAFEDRVVAQDVPVVESQRPERLPIDLQAELHLRSDRTAIAYRKWLRELGMTFATA